jgi:uncharacterized membrane protein HdeD (DUF308 family)
MEKLLDLRFVIGLFFLVIGVLLLVYSFLTSSADDQEVNTWCGIIFSIFGAFMVFLSFQKGGDDRLTETRK